MNCYTLDKQKNVILTDTPNMESIARTHLQRCVVSTVFLGIDHSYGTGTRPILFETMIFNSEGKDIYCNRYSSYDMAICGHNMAIDALITNNKEQFGS